VPGLHATPSPAPRKRRFPILPLLAVLVVVGGAVVAGKYVLDSTEDRRVVEIQTEAFRFTLPDTPVIQPVNQVVDGYEIPGMQWSVGSVSQELIVIAMDFGMDLDEVMRQATFDGAISGGAIAAAGTVTSDTWTVTNGVYVRDTIVALPSGMMYIKSFGKGPWAVFLMAGTAGSTQPEAFDALVASFSFV
jgi:hypothetical protein